MKILIDMNLSPRWVRFFSAAHIEAVHWSAAGSANAADTEIMAYAKTNGFLVLTHDLDSKRRVSYPALRGTIRV
jgi:predicted nuclease of predicted toxin-antitoxin system